MQTTRLVYLLVILLTGSVMYTPPTGAGETNGSPPLYGYPDLDVRTLTAAPTQTQLDASARFINVVPAPGRQAAGSSGLSLRWNGYGTPQMLRRHSGFLTPPSSRQPSEIVRDFLADHSALFRFSAETFAGLELIDAYVTKHNGVTHVGFQLTDAGLPVFQAIITATVDARGRIVMLGGSYDPGASARNSIQLDEVAAITAALEAVGVDAPDHYQLRQSDRGFAFENTIANMRNPAPFTAELVTFSMGGAADARVAWRVVTAVNKTGDYETIVDAETGEILFRHNRVMSDHGAEGNVYQVQNPTLGNQQTTSFIGINGSWVDDRTTDGNNAIAYHDLDDTNTVGYQPQTPDNADSNYQHFDYIYSDAINSSGGTDVITDRDAVITQAFYYVNMLHQYYYNLGFDEVARNFQDNNFGRGGLQSDRVLVEVDNDFNGGACCNAFMNTPADGGNPRLTLRVGLAPDNLNMHRAMNGDTVTHEFGHGVSNRLVGSGTLGSGTQTGALGEGWSDALATERWNDPVYGEYNNGNAATGIRGVAYDTSNLVYSDLCSGGCQVHNDGRIWATVMWQVRAALIDTYGSVPGAANHAQLLIDGMKNTPTSPSYLDARDGYLTADVTNNGGANQCLLWRVFAEREMGSLAASLGNGSLVTPSTVVPSECEPTADAGGPYSTPEGQSETVDGSNSMEASDPSSGALSYAWDLDGDGSFDDAFTVTASFTNVLDDGVFNIGLEVTNAAGISDSDSTTVTVTNVAPVVAVPVIAPEPSNEGSAATASATFTDVGIEDTHQCTVDYGDGTGDQAATVLSGTCTGTAHTYADNGIYSVIVKVTDDDGGVGSNSSLHQVNNVAPLFGASSNSAELCGLTPGEGTVEVSADFSDPGFDWPLTPSLESFTATIDWGDGTVEAGVVDAVTGSVGTPSTGTVSGSHVYANGGIFTITITVEDDDGASDTIEMEALVSGAGFNAGEIQVVGTPLIDWINIVFERRRIRTTVELMADPGKPDLITIEFRVPRNAVTSIRVHACAGDDRIVVDNAVHAPALLDGGEDNDYIQGGNGISTLEGGPGADILLAGNGGNTLNGGDGEDELTGGNGPDILSGDGGDDTLYGRFGADFLDGGDDTDLCYGGAGADTVINCEPIPPKSP